MTFDVDGAPIAVSISMGISTLPLLGTQDVDAFVKEADRALYRARRDGRNRVRASRS